MSFCYWNAVPTISTSAPLIIYYLFGKRWGGEAVLLGTKLEREGVDGVGVQQHLEGGGFPILVLQRPSPLQAMCIT